jgi:hypothetical protein
VQLQRVAGNRAVLQMVGRPVFIQRAHDSAETDASDHGVDSLDLNANTEDMTWGELTDLALRRRNNQTLGAVFINTIIAIYGVETRNKINDSLMLAGYLHWKDGGVFTRTRFDSLIQEMVKQSTPSTPTTGMFQKKADDGLIQTARTGNTYSVNTGYTGNSNGFAYNNVVYLRDGGGNIDFAANPTTTVTGYNSTETPTIDSKDITWSNPMDNASLVQMAGDVNEPEYGLMPSGKKVKLKTASRAQHFAIADDLYPNSRSGTWTWHHLTPKYQMILVDMRVHAKHGHNGGVLLWNT